MRRKEKPEENTKKRKKKEWEKPLDVHNVVLVLVNCYKNIYPAPQFNMTVVHRNDKKLYFCINLNVLE